MTEGRHYQDIMVDKYRSPQEAQVKKNIETVDICQQWLAYVVSSFIDSFRKNIDNLQINEYYEAISKT